jgi:hypothetical protein
MKQETLNNESSPANQLFLLSPASCSGPRAHMLVRPQAKFNLAERLRANGAPLGEVFSFLSGLYFRGKLTYALRFGRTLGPLPQVLIITAGRGLLRPQTVITVDDIRQFALIPIDPSEPQYVKPLVQDAERLAGQLGPNSRVVLLGSVASPKYGPLLLRIFKDRLYFPTEFVGRGDMSRGGLLLRSVQANQELDYEPLLGAEVRGARAAKLPPRYAE